MNTFDFGMVKDPECFEENRLPAHSDHFYYENKDAAFGDSMEDRKLLNGTWKFSYAENYASAVKGFEKPDFDVSSWDDIPVPAHIQLCGYDHPAYVNVQYPWDGVEQIEPGQIPEKYNPVGTYVTFFTVPKEWTGRPVFISFQGAESGIAVWCNGQYVGYSEDSFTPSEFDLTPYLKEGKNRLAVQDFKWTAGSWLEDQDMFRFSGIFRDVYLFTVPKVHLEDVSVRAIPREDLAIADLSIAVKTTGRGRLAITLTDPERKTVLERTEDLTESTALSFPVENPHLWSAEDPALYHLTLIVLDESGAFQEKIPMEVGFRRFELKESIMYLNGKRIVFYGVNRHEFSADHGRVMDEATIKKDLITMKRNNINAVRTCHYPNRSELYRLCDELGLYLIDEVNLETHGNWDQIEKGLRDLSYALPGNRPEYQELILDRARSMYERDKNHCAILIWSCGNESFGGLDIFNESEYLRHTDPTRLVHYEGVFHDRRYPKTSDMESTMYATVDYIRDYLKDHKDKPYIQCEYAHAMGNSIGALDEYTDLSDEEPLYQGGFIWDYIDQALWKTDRFGKKYLGYGGDFGDHPSDGSFSGDGICYADDRTPTPKMQEVRYDYQPVKMTFDGLHLTVRNRNLFRNTDAYRCIITLEKDGTLLQKTEGSISVPPLTVQEMDLPVTIPEDAGEYVVTVSFCLKDDTAWAKAGHEVAYGQSVIRKEEKAEQKAPAKPLQVVAGALNIGVYGEHFSALFSALQGGLVSYKYDGREMIKVMPRPNFWRAVTENDNANLLPFRAAQWKLAGRYATYKTEHGRNGDPYQVTVTDDSVTITWTLHLPVTPAKDCTLSYTVTGDGKIRTHLSLPEVSDIGELPECSMLFTMDAACDHLTWYGRGPESTYPDVRHGKIGIYENHVTDNMARYLVPQECGAKMDTRWAKVTDKNGHGLLFTMPDLFFSALPWTPDEIENARHTDELPPVLNTIVRIGYQMGVGGDDTWGALVHPQYLLDPSKPTDVVFTFQGI
ncbi:MAG: glycoside hydrolase family 2 TIM barrel-domain containing protein [Lachnospiraceae bacterium]|jgi:beta-galactosidase